MSFKAFAMIVASLLSCAASSRYGGGAVLVCVFSCIILEKFSLSTSVASEVGLGSCRDASDAPNIPSCCGHRGCGVVPVGVKGWDCSRFIELLRRSAAKDISRIPVLESLSSVSVASVLNSWVAIGSNPFCGPVPFVPLGPSFHMVSLSV